MYCAVQSCMQLKSYVVKKIEKWKLKFERLQKSFKELKARYGDKIWRTFSPIVAPDQNSSFQEGGGGGRDVRRRVRFFVPLLVVKESLICSTK